MTKIFKVNKRKKVLFCIILLIILGLIIYFLFCWLINPSEYTSWLMPSKKSVIIFSIYGIVCIFFSYYVIIKFLFIKNDNILINSDGIFYGLYLYKNKFIYWEDIKEIKSITYNSIKYVAIYVKSIKKYENLENKLSKFIFKLNIKTVGTPFIMYSIIIECSYIELENSIKKGWKEYKKEKLKEK